MKRDWYERHQGLIWVCTTIMALMAYTYTTFATVDYVDKKHNDVLSVLTRMENKLDNVQDKVYELNGEIPRSKKNE